MKSLSLLLTLTSLSLFAADAPKAAPAEKVAVKTKTKAKAPNPSMAPITDVAGLPRVLLIGDSISIGYTLPVRQELAGKANVDLWVNPYNQSEGVNKLLGPVLAV